MRLHRIRLSVRLWNAAYKRDLNGTWYLWADLGWWRLCLIRAVIAFVLIALPSIAFAQRTLSCPASQSAVTDGTFATINYPTAAASGQPTPITLSYSQKSGTAFPVGMTSVTVTARWKNGQVITCRFTVTVTVAVPPPPPPPTVPAVDCLVSAWAVQPGTWTATQERTDTWTRTVVTPPANGGAACPAPLQFTVGLKATALTSPPPPPPPGSLSVPLTVQEGLYPGSVAGVARVMDPVTVGLPLPDDAATGATSPSQLTVAGATLGQFRVLGRWPSGRIKWVLVDTQASLSAGQQNTALAVTAGNGNFGGPDLATDNGDTIAVATGA